jgi:hypothetical protein
MSETVRPVIIRKDAQESRAPIVIADAQPYRNGKLVERIEELMRDKRFSALGTWKKERCLQTTALAMSGNSAFRCLATTGALWASNESVVCAQRFSVER